MEKLFYVYEYYIISTNTVFYVGKGTGGSEKNSGIPQEIIKGFTDRAEQCSWIYRAWHETPLQSRGISGEAPVGPCRYGGNHSLYPWRIVA